MLKITIYKALSLYIIQSYYMFKKKKKMLKIFHENALTETELNVIVTDDFE